MATYTSMSRLKSTLLDKIKRRIEYNSDYEVDDELIEDFIDSAVLEIKDWRRLEDDTEILTGRYDNNIIRYVIESYNMLGIEGQSYESNGSSSKQYNTTPLSNLRSSITQRI